MERYRITTRRLVGKTVRELRRLLLLHRATARRPLLLPTPVTVSQVVDGRGYLEINDLQAVKVWHDRTTVVIEDTEGRAQRLVDSYVRSSSGHYEDSWWDALVLKETIRKMIS